jgi:hypothetical protein
MLILIKTILASIGLWFLSLILLFIFPDLLPVISGFAVLLSLPIALVLFVLALIALIKEKRKLWPVVCICLILAVSYLSLRQVMYWGALTHLSLNKRRYEIAAQKMLAAQDDAERRSICGEKCWLLSSDHHGLVAFHYVHGFLNWHDIIYDPSGRLVTLKTWEERNRFNIYFISAEHLTGDWYLGHFGD